MPIMHNNPPPVLVCSDALISLHYRWNVPGVNVPKHHSPAPLLFAAVTLFAAVLFISCISMRWHSQRFSLSLQVIRSLVCLVSAEATDPYRTICWEEYVMEEENTHTTSLLCRWDSSCVLSICFPTACVQRDFFGPTDGERKTWTLLANVR